ncbi:hypothetical protein D1BOALGB6SA_8395 [Olavius sp. associated proteobacterium Delta 1]|nr:hypothetical protein D1BOALGB6SA_8395 [Olavius sp. associated proteobacterium Delta 1]
MRPEKYAQPNVIKPPALWPAKFFQFKKQIITQDLLFCRAD